MQYLNGFSAILYNKPLISAVLAWLIAQLIKLTLALFSTKRIDFTKLVASGGMPSSHSATVCALATAIGELQGYDSSMFGIASIVALVIMYDASGVRRAAGKQAKVLNKIVKELENNELHFEERLKELLGHTPIEVFIGGLLGIFVTLFYLY
ncbi:MAG: divergent PAP2 family protein [Eubacteriales bacterium]